MRFHLRFSSFLAGTYFCSDSCPVTNLCPASATPTAAAGTAEGPSCLSEPAAPAVDESA